MFYNAARVALDSSKSRLSTPALSCPPAVAQLKTRVPYTRTLLLMIPLRWAD